MINFSSSPIICHSARVFGSEYDVCVEAAQNRWANTKKGAYGKGMINSDSDPYRVERVGLVGEFAFAKLCGLSVDIGYKHGGDQYDFLLEDGRTVDVKVAAKRYRYEAGLIYAQTGSGTDIPVKCDIYAFGFLEYDKPDARMANAIFVGWCDKETVIHKPLVKAQTFKSNHKNKEIPYAELRSMSELLDADI